MESVNWDDYFMTMVYLVAMRSKDDSTHIGAVVVDPKNRVVSLGYNSFPRGIRDDVPERQERPEKYFWFEHGERNAIYNARRDLEGCKMYTNGIPCMDCSRAVVQAGLVHVTVDKRWHDTNYNQWKEHAERALILFKEAGITVSYWDGKLLDIVGRRDGQKF